MKTWKFWCRKLGFGGPPFWLGKFHSSLRVSGSVPRFHEQMSSSGRQDNVFFPSSKNCILKIQVFKVENSREKAEIQLFFQHMFTIAIPVPSSCSIFLMRWEDEFCQSCLFISHLQKKTPQTSTAITNSLIVQTFPLLIQFLLPSFKYTPPKTNMDAQNYGWEKVIPFKYGNCLYLYMLNFWILYNIDTTTAFPPGCPTLTPNLRFRSSDVPKAPSPLAEMLRRPRPLVPEAITRRDLVGYLVDVPGQKLGGSMVIGSMGYNL